MSQPNQPEDALEQGLKELHERLGQQLQSGLSGSDAENILLDTLARSTHLLEQHVSVPQYNTPGETVRPRVVDMYARFAKLLGRNTPDAVMADTRAMLAKLGDRIGYNPGQGKRGKLTPSQHIEEVIIPMSDIDMEPHLYVQGTYHIPSMMTFHSVLRVWRSRGKDLGRIGLTLESLSNKE